MPPDEAPHSLRERVEHALAEIPDPELGIDIFNLGLIGAIGIGADGGVHVEYTLTRLGCPAAPLIHEAIVRNVESLEGVTAVDAEFVMYPPWTPERMSDDARTALMGGL